MLMHFNSLNSACVTIIAFIVQEKQQEHDKMRQKQRTEIWEDYKPAWSPASKIIPCGR